MIIRVLLYVDHPSEALNDQIDSNELVLSCQSGSRKAKAKLFDLYSHGIYNLCLRLLKDQSLAGDALQNTFLKAYGSISQLKEAKAVGGWLRQIAVRESLAQAKSQPRWQEPDELDPEPEPEEAWWSELSFSQINQEITNLPEGARQVVVLFLLEEYKHAEISALLGISVSTSKSQYQRGRSLLRKRLKAKYHG